LRLSIVVPVYNEAENVLPLLAEIDRALAGQPPVEVIFVDDGSSDETPARLQAAMTGRTDLRLLRHAPRSGQSAAVVTGVRAATGDWVATLDGDGQNDPADIPRMIEETGRDPGLALVGGLRKKRRDTASRRLAGRLANGLRQSILKDGCSDTGCGLKLFRRDAFLDLPTFDGMHRFLPALFLRQGYGVAFIPVGHRPRERGTSKYSNFRRAMIGISDLLGVWWLMRRARRPAVTEERG
ncbi:MAG: dolichol-phosphate mannosyltransferase, partial [Rhodospirillaceae bacterium]|jgi:dolichol-phosphate mannosyltransferase|nr:dolichol-phosphate mannosyltransferase [Rhodospirillaceae bacterium]